MGIVILVKFEPRISAPLNHLISYFVVTITAYMLHIKIAMVVFSRVKVIRVYLQLIYP